MAFVPLDQETEAGGDSPKRGFIPLEEAGVPTSAVKGFTPVEDDKPSPSVLRNVALNNPLTAAGEAALNLGSQFISIPAAGLAGIGATINKAVGLSDTEPADAVRYWGDKLTYEPRGEMGKSAAEVVAYPFEKLAEAGQYVGDKTLAATGSPVAATVADTAVNALPMMVSPIKRGAGVVADHVLGKPLIEAPRIEPTITAEQATMADIAHAQTVDQAIVVAAAHVNPPIAAVPEVQAPQYRGRAVVEIPDTELAQLSASPLVPMSMRRVMGEEIQRRQQAMAIDQAAPMVVTESERSTLKPLSEEVAQDTTVTPRSDGPHAAEIPALDNGNASVRNEALPEAIEGGGPNSPSAMLGDNPEVQASRGAFHPGENYVGLRSDALESVAQVEPQAKPIKREDILVPLAKALDTSIYEGRIKGKALGTYTPGKEVVRIKKAADLEVAAHEIAHLLDDRIPSLREAWALGPDRKLFAEELKGVSYDKKNVREGFAEFVRLWMTQPEEARARVPNFNHWFTGFIKDHQYGPAILKAREGMQAWFGQAAIDRARSKIGVNRKLSEAMDGVWDKLRQSTVDDLHGVYRMEWDMTGKINPGGAYETARLARASHSITDGAIRYGYPVKKADGSFTYTGKGLEEILKPVAKNLDDALLYFVGRSAQELMGQGREHLFTPGEIKAMLALETPEAKTAFKEYQAWNKGILDFAEAEGVINPAARAMWQRQAYMPFHRVGQAGDWKGGKPGDWSGIKALTGGTENLRDILGNMVSNAAQLIDKAVKNEARQKIATLSEDVRGGGKFMTEIPKDSRMVKIQPEQVLDAVLKTLGIDRRKQVTPAMEKTISALREQIESSPEAFEFMLHDLAPAGGNVVAVLEGGKPRYFEVADPILMRALSSIDREQAHWITHWLGYPKRIGQLTITLTPDFMVRNISRDTLMGAVMSRTGFKPVMDSLEGMRLRLTNDFLYKDYIANGGGMASIYLDEAKFRAKLERFYSSKGIDYRTVLDTPEKLLAGIESIADAFEMSTRLGEYKRAIERGDNPRHAAYLGREVSTDFAMRGDSKALGFAYDVIMFLKPALLSFDRLGRGLMHDPNKGAIATKAGMMALASMALYLLNKDDPRYQDLKDWDRDAYWHFFIGSEHYRMPKTWELGSMASVAERTLERTLSEDPENLGKDVMRILGTTFDLNLMPQVVAPLYEQATNRNSFTKAPIETPGMENLQPFLKAKPGTSETLRAAGMATRNLPESLQVNPVRAEALLRGYFNTWAAYGLMLSDRAFFSDRMPAMRADEMPVVKSFYQQEPAKGTKYEEMFYNMLGEAKRLGGTLRELDDLGHSDMADEKEKSPLAGEAKPLERANKQLRAIGNEMNSVRRNPDLSPGEKRERLDSLMVERNALFKGAVQGSQQAQKEIQP